MSILTSFRNASSPSHRRQLPSRGTDASSSSLFQQTVLNPREETTEATLPRDRVKATEARAASRDSTTRTRRQEEFDTKGTDFVLDAFPFHSFLLSRLECPPPLSFLRFYFSSAFVSITNPRSHSPPHPPTNQSSDPLVSRLLPLLYSSIWT